MSGTLVAQRAQLLEDALGRDLAVALEQASDGFAEGIQLGQARRAIGVWRERLVRLTAGTAPDGTQLRPGMPRFKLTAGEFADILAYLKTQ